VHAATAQQAVSQQAGGYASKKWLQRPHFNH